MDPFLPGEIPLMVLRYLAANKCETAAMALIEEMPLLKAYVPPKPAKFTNADYLKYLARSSVNSSGLKEVLTDYGNSKILAEEILDSGISITASFPGDSLHCKLQTIHDVLKAPTSDQSTEGPASSISSTRIEDVKRVPPIITIDRDTNTDEKYECQTCASNRLNKKSFAESSCQTEELSGPQLGLQDEIPKIFCRTLLNDSNLQQKIVQTINQHIQDPESSPSRPESIVQKIASKAETETLIDKFMEELFQDFPIGEDDLTGALGLPFGGEISNPETFEEVERNMRLMFAEPGISSGPNVNSLESNSLPSTSTQNELDTPVSGSADQHSTVNTPLKFPSVVTGTADTEADKTKEKTNEDSSSLPGSSSTTSGSRRPSSVKRITPTPIPSTVNPVFKTSVVVEKQTVDFGEKTSKVSVIRKEIETPRWNKLNRKSIQPKIPGHFPPPPAEPSKVRVITKDATDKVLLGVNIKIGSPAPENSTKTENSIGGDDKATANVGATPVKAVTNRLETSPTTSQKKRKATPVKLSPEKAKNIEYNFVCISSEKAGKSPSKKKSSLLEMGTKTDSVPSDLVSARKKDSAMEKNESVCAPSNSVCKSTQPDENSHQSQPIVTPMQGPQPIDMNSAGLKTISPNALRLLIDSATKLQCCSVQMANFNNKKKSFSTPRKKKHVRNLSFATPPSLKATTPGPNIQLHTVSTDPRDSLKRKAIEDNYDFKSKKRLSWPESGKKPSEKSHPSSGTEVGKEGNLDGNVTMSESEPNQNTTAQKALPLPGVVSAAPSMPTILEESSSNISISIDEVPPQEAASIPSSASSQAEIPTCNPSGPDLSSNRLESESPITVPQMVLPSSKSDVPFYAIPVSQNDGSVVLQYYQLADDMTALIPVSLIASPMPEESPRRSSFVPPPVFINPDGTVNAFLPVQGQELSTSLQSPAGGQKPSLTSNEPRSETNPAALDTATTQGESTNRVPVSQTVMSPLSSVINSVARGDFPEKNQAIISPARRVAFDLSISSSSGSDASPPIIEYPSPKRKSTKFSKASQVENETLTNKSRSPNQASSAQTQGTRKSSRVKTKVADQGDIMKESEETQNKAKEQTNSLQFSSDKKIREDPAPEPKHPPPSQEYSPEEQRPKRSRSGRKEKDKSKKPKIQFGKFSKEEIFGKTPEKPKNQSDAKVSTPKTKLSVDAVAARTVAAEAVPLGTPRRSPRKHLTTVKSSVLSSPIGMQRQVSPSPNSASRAVEASSVPSLPLTCPAVKDSDLPTEKIQSAETSPTESQSRSIQPPLIKVTKPHENASFNIVPAPIGFPDPTPIKNFVNFNHSELNGLNSPLVTPFKVGLPVNMNETQFTLPPTPRMIEDFDSESNSAHSLRLVYDGMVPVNLLTSTPLKPGVPRTPGKCSSSSNSHSPVMPEKTKTLEQPPALVTSFPQPKPPPPLLTQPHSVPVIEKEVGTNTLTKVIKTVLPEKAVPSEDPALDLSPTKSKEKADKSDGELSSSDEENEPHSPIRSQRFAVPSKTMTIPPKLLPPSPCSSLTIISTASKDSAPAKKLSVVEEKSEMKSQTAKNIITPTRIVQQPQLQNKPHISISLSPNIMQYSGINFRVGDKEKRLTLSEQATLVSLLELQSGNVTRKPALEQKKDGTNRPVGTASVISQQQQHHQQPPIITVQPQPPGDLHEIVKNKSIHDLVRLARQRQAKQNLSKNADE